jgi:hypothetical protein
MPQHQNLDLVGAITPHNEHQELESEQDDPVPHDTITADSILGPGGPITHKPAPQTP